VLTGLRSFKSVLTLLVFIYNVAMIRINKSKQSLLKVGILAGFTILFLYYYFSTHSLAHTYSHPSSVKHSASIGDAIPNRVHYVYIMPSSSTDDDITFELKHFISIYSSLLYFKPDVIFIHTDASNATIERAQAGGPNINKWAHKILTLPSVVVQHVIAPSVTTNGIPITRIVHKSDFVRTRAVLDYGGIYLDWDVYALRSVAVLRESGFANVVGRQKLGAVNSGFWMSRKGSALMREWVEKQHEVYTGGWTVHSNDLLSSISEQKDSEGVLTRLVEAVGLAPERQKEVLILERNAFAPSSWELVDAKALFEAHPGEPVEGLSSFSATSAEQGAPIKQRGRKFSWEIDYSDSYALHAFKAVADQKIENFDPEGITLRYILARNSNFACAVYPAVKYAVDTGLISADD
jgi:Glycosyltransferase sugar-binding region containing DXD motif